MYILTYELYYFQVINAEQKVNKSYELTDEGRQVIAHGSHEAIVYNAVPKEGIAQAALMV